MVFKGCPVWISNNNSRDTTAVSSSKILLIRSEARAKASLLADCGWLTPNGWLDRGALTDGGELDLADRGNGGTMFRPSGVEDVAGILT